MWIGTFDKFPVAPPPVLRSASSVRCDTSLICRLRNANRSSRKLSSSVLVVVIPGGPPYAISRLLVRRVASCWSNANQARFPLVHQDIGDACVSPIHMPSPRDPFHASPVVGRVVVFLSRSATKSLWNQSVMDCRLQVLPSPTIPLQHAAKLEPPSSHPAVPRVIPQTRRRSDKQARGFPLWSW